MLYIKTPKYYAIYHVKGILDKINMPKYAVAVGRKVGIYDNYDECKQQILNYPNAKFKKFDSVTDAEAFIKKFSVKAINLKCHSFEGTSQPSVENVNQPELMKIEKISPSSDLFSLTNRVSRIEEKLTKFISDTTNALEKVVKRLNELESKFINYSDCIAEPPLKKVKTEDEVEAVAGELIKNDNGYVVVYTDGACTNNGKTGARAGIGIWFNDDHPLNVSAPVQGPATNNNAEIQAARVAIMQGYHAGVRRLNIKTDSKFVINCITAWIHKWKKNDWQLSSGGSVKNKEELVKLDEAIQLLDSVEWDYVAGHRGVKGNEMADKLAREGAQRYKTNVTYSKKAQLENVKFFDPEDPSSS